MRLKRMIALLCASLYLLTGTAAAGEITKEETEQQIVLQAGGPAAEEDHAVSQNAAPQMPSARAALKTVPSAHKVTVNGQAVSPQAYNIDGYNYFKLRDIAFLLSGTTASFDVQWNGEKNAIDLISGAAYTAVGGEMSVASSSTLRVQESTAKLLLDGSGVSIKGYNINGNNYYKIADVSTAMGFTAAFESATQTVQIKTPAAPDPEPQPEPDPEGPQEPEPEPAEPEEPFVTGVYQVKVSDYLSVRTGPGLTYAAVGKLMNGTEIVVDSITDNWAHIMVGDDGSDRYCSADYLVRVKDYGTSEGEPEPDIEPVRPERTSNIDGKMTVIVDPGHGGSDVGAHNEDGSLDEKHINLYVSQYLEEYLEEAGVRVIMVRDTLEEGSSLSLRGQIMEEYVDTVDLFFSVHHNAANTTARGAEALAQIVDKDGGPTKILAEALLEEYEKLGIPIRQVVFREGSNGDYYYTNRVASALGIPALTSEFCFIDNEEDQKFIDSEEDWQAEALAQFHAIMRYFEQVEY